MEAREYESLAAVEDRMWWFHAVHTRLLDAFRQYAPSARLVVVDAGCGTGGFLARLRSIAQHAVVCGVDAHHGACITAGTKAGLPVIRGEVERLPFATGTVDAMFSVDVLCHADVEPQSALAEAHRCLRRGGILILNLPSYGWMRSSHDERVRNDRRFTRTLATNMLRCAGFGIGAATYWNSLLFPAMAAHRLLTKSRRATSDLRTFRRPVDRTFRAVLAAERLMAASGFHAPFGGSILIVAVNDG